MSIRKCIGKTLRDRDFQERALRVAIQTLITIHKRVRGRWLV